MKTIKLKLVQFFINNLFSGTKFFKTKYYLMKYIGVEIGIDSKIVGPIYFNKVLSLTIGNNCWIGKNLNMDGNGSVIIGDNVDIGPHVIINTGGHAIGPRERRAGEGCINKIIISKGSWIGTSTTIVGNTIIGEAVVVAAGAVVPYDIPDNVLVAGVPAKIKKYI